MKKEANRQRLAVMLLERRQIRAKLRKRRARKFRFEVKRRMSEWSRSQSRAGSRVSMISREEMQLKKQEIEDMVRAEQAQEIEADLEEEARDAALEREMV